MTDEHEPQYTLLLFFKRNPKLSPAEFRTYYEANHASLVMELAKTAKGLLRYTRRYLNHEASDPALGNPFTVFGEPVPTVPYDMVNEVTFQTKADAAEFSRLMYDIEANATRVLVDEDTLFVKGQMRGMIVDAVVSIP
ncbi:EthD domain-containing protein [Durotheca rogersii]|uniref:EthD domain-containing protein n=1 Tax=Durotheca rogersii TaxID=419775 RepID=UPI00221FB6C4|nr:EthD domain-containing protein [Durotheca rogersii]KAI5868235.1 EthD domain-containing protein [Durotheca rogersii]